MLALITLSAVKGCFVIHQSVCLCFTIIFTAFKVNALGLFYFENRLKHPEFPSDHKKLDPGIVDCTIDPWTVALVWG